MSLVDKIKELIAKEQEPATTPAPEPQQPEPAPEPGNKPDPQPDPTPETFTREEVTKMLDEQKKETEQALTEIVKTFKGTEVPPASDPPEPVNTSDFSQWNKELQEIKDNLNK